MLLSGRLRFNKRLFNTFIRSRSLRPIYAIVLCEVVHQLLQSAWRQYLRRHPQLLVGVLREFRPVGVRTPSVPALRTARLPHHVVLRTPQARFLVLREIELSLQCRVEAQQCVPSVLVLQRCDDVQHGLPPPTLVGSREEVQRPLGHLLHVSRESLPLLRVWLRGPGRELGMQFCANCGGCLSPGLGLFDAVFFICGTIKSVSSLFECFRFSFSFLFLIL